MKLIFTLIWLLITPLLAAQSVVATTGWTGAFAEAAGAEDVHVLAPYDMAHPPEYELRPSDLPLVASADLVLYAGYEVIAERLVSSTSSDATAIRIRTGYTGEILTESVRKIGAALGTLDAAEATLRDLSGFLSEWKREVSLSRFRGKPVLVHFHQAGLAREIGLNVAGVFGPGPLEARQLAELTALEPLLIIDNGHNPIAGPLVETTGAESVVWINFPGRDGTRSLLDVLSWNRQALR